ncbi:hypothetical protein [Mycoplasma sp. SG1]|uniref:hypothetical protein n=1 Tax=Mycoplasma sp. SG1 TaxID=2810348 RepID=UPI0020249EAC|nr:hypothetical protein [Mycoplasma sp. SG1]URM53060.1 hypothetical protein JRW51_01800 [Mycoplasma sp. SG1]
MKTIKIKNKFLKSLLSTGTVALLTLVSFGGCGSSPKHTIPWKPITPDKHNKPWTPIGPAKHNIPWTPVGPAVMVKVDPKKELNKAFDKGIKNTTTKGNIQINSLFNVSSADIDALNALATKGTADSHFSVANVIADSFQAFKTGGADVQASVVVNDDSIKAPTQSTFAQSEKDQRAENYANNFIIDIDYTLDATDTIVAINDSSKIHDPFASQEYGNMVTTLNNKGDKINVNKNFEKTPKAFDPSQPTNDNTNSKHSALFNDLRIQSKNKEPRDSYYSLPNELSTFGHNNTGSDIHTIYSDPLQFIKEVSSLLLQFGYSKNLSFINYQDPTSDTKSPVYGIKADSMTFAKLFVEKTFGSRTYASIISVDSTGFWSNFKYKDLAFNVNNLTFLGGNPKDPYLGYSVNGISVIK